MTLNLITGFCVIIGVLVVAQHFSRLTRLPVPSAQFLLGALAVHGIVAFGVDTGLRYDNFHDLTFYLFLPILIFAATQELDTQAFTKRLPTIGALAFVGILITTSLVAVVMYYGIGHPTGFPWAAALLTGILLAATDPAAVTGQRGLAHTEKQHETAVMLEGESLLNDAASVVIFMIILAFALEGSVMASTFADAGITFGREVLGGALFGIAFGYGGKLYFRLSQASSASIWASLVLAFASYHCALALHTSGVIACLVTGFMLKSAEHRPQIMAPFWEFLGSTANGIIFVLMGATITISMFTERWLAILIAIAAVLVARLAAVVLTLRLTPGYAFNLRESTLIGAMGMRGALTLALALILPTELPYWWTIQSVAYGVVLFDLFLLAPVAPRLFDKFLPESQQT